MTTQEPDQSVDVADDSSRARPWLWIVGATVIASGLIGGAVAFKLASGPPYEDVRDLVGDVEALGYSCAYDYVYGSEQRGRTNASCIALRGGPTLFAEILDTEAQVDETFAKQQDFAGYWDRYIVIGDRWIVETTGKNVARDVAAELGGEVHLVPADEEKSADLEATQECADAVSAWTAQLIDGTASVEEMAYAIGYDSFEAQTVVDLFSEAQQTAFAEGAAVAAEFIRDEAFSKCQEEYDPLPP